jgi:hypothetical protein
MCWAVTVIGRGRRAAQATDRASGQRTPGGAPSTPTPLPPARRDATRGSTIERDNQQRALAAYRIRTLSYVPLGAN